MESATPPQDQPAAVAQQAPAPGQWVYTAEYGWLWMPYGQAYTDVPSNGATPNMYVYYPAAGWCWMVAPWVWGWGPMPYFGAYGPGRFRWYGNGYGHWYGYRGGAYGPAWRGGGYFRGGQWVSPGHAYAAPSRAAPAPAAAHAAPRGEGSRGGGDHH